MAKFLKSIFHPSETQRAVSYGGSAESGDDRNHDSSGSMEVRRKLSISRSGRMKQAQKKRLSLSLDIYGGEIDIQPADKPKTIEYHVSQKTQARDNPLAISNQRRRSGDSLSSTESGKVRIREKGNQVTVVPKMSRISNEVKTPEEEIDSAFEIIDKASIGVIGS